MINIAFRSAWAKIQLFGDIKYLTNLYDIGMEQQSTAFYINSEIHIQIINMQCLWKCVIWILFQGIRLMIIWYFTSIILIGQVHMINIGDSEVQWAKIQLFGDIKYPMTNLYDIGMEPTITSRKE